jgi:hypothetical protein
VPDHQQPPLRVRLDQRVEAFGADGMLSAGNQTATSVRRSGASGTETAAPYLNFFLDRYATAYRAELDHLVICMEQGLTPSPGFDRRPGGAGPRGCRDREHEDGANRPRRFLNAAIFARSLVCTWKDQRERG